LPGRYHASGYKWIPQTWNNCGPANVAQALEPFGWPGDQAKAATYLKPNKEDKNVSPSEIVTYVSLISKETKVKGGIGALTRVGGDLTLIKRLVSQQFSVILETGFSLPEEGWMGHYLTVIGYDDSKGVLYGLDTFLGDGPDSAGVPEKYDDLDRRWRQFNRVYIVIYPLERENEVLNILGHDTDLVYNVLHALDTARREAAANPNNQYAWFNMGSNYTLLGQYAQATIAFDRASRVGGGLPFRMLWYQFGPLEAYYHVGNYASVLALVSASLKTTTYVEETYYWRGMVAAAQGKSAQAIEDFNRVLKFNPNFALAAQMRDQVASGTFKPPITGG
jgi:tetratricopeptide (TPR) repeat protein